MTADALIDLRRHLFDSIAWRLSRRELRALMVRDDIEGIIAATEDYIGRGFYARIDAMQKAKELALLANLARKQQPKVIVEIGTAKGGTLYVWTRSNPQAELIVSIDLPGGSFGGGYDHRRIRLYREFAYGRPGTRMEFLRANSHAQSSVDQLKAILAGRAIDFLYIDGDHVYDGVKLDFQMYSQFARPGALVAFHDIVTTGNGHDVSRFWNDIKTKYPHEEFVQNRQGSMGIGVLHL